MVGQFWQSWWSWWNWWRTRNEVEAEVLVGGLARAKAAAGATVAGATVGVGSELA